MINDDIDFTNPKMLREEAEEQLKEKQKKVKLPEKEIDIKKLMHELQVHQIELEMQNEELKLAYEISEAALKKYTMLYDFAPVGFFTLDPDGSICDLNFTGAEMLQEKRFSLQNCNFKLFVSEKSLPEFKNFSKLYTSYSKEVCEVVLGYDNKLYVRHIWKALSSKKTEMPSYSS